MRRGIGLVAVAFVMLTGTAEANTVLHVNGTSGTNTGNCESAPCKTITYAVTQGEAVADLVTIDVAAGDYTEDIPVGSLDSGLTITGAGSGSDPSTSTIITGVASTPTIYSSSGAPSSLSLDHVRLVVPSGDTAPALESGADTDFSLTDVVVDSAGTSPGIITSGDVGASGGSITMTDAGAGPAIETSGGIITLTNVPVSEAGAAPALIGGSPTLTGSPITGMNTSSTAPAVLAPTGSLSAVNSPIDMKGPAPAVEVSNGGLTLSGSAITIEATTGTEPAIIVTATGWPVSISGAPIDVRDDGSALIATTGGAATLSNVKVTLENAANTNVALELTGRSSLSHVTLTYAGTEPLLYHTGSLTVTDSSFTSSSAAAAPAFDLSGGSSGLGDDDSFTRSTLKQPSTAAVPAIVASDVNLLLDSSEVLGGQQAVDFAVTGGAARTLTIASSTIDAGTLGVRDAAPVTSVYANSDNTSGSSARVLVEGSILIEPPTATRGGTSGNASVTCSNTEVPATTQTASSSLGSINCGAGNGNTSTVPLASIFANPATGYALNPSWGGVDSVPDGAISLPAPFVDSATDLLGNPRVLNGLGGCSAGLRDKGAIELTGHAGTLPVPQISGPSTVSTASVDKFKASAPNVTGVSVSFSWHASDGATGSGATFSHRFPHAGKQSVNVTATGVPGCTGSATKKVTAVAPATITGLKISPKRFGPRGGASVSYKDSVVATATLTVQRKTGKHYKNVRTLTHHDKGGKVELPISGHGLTKGSYRIQVVAKNAVGKGKPAFVTFAIIG